MWLRTRQVAQRCFILSRFTALEFSSASQLYHTTAKRVH